MYKRAPTPQKQQTGTQVLINIKHHTFRLKELHLAEGARKWTIPGPAVDAKTPWEPLQHMLGRQAEQESQRPSWCGGSGAPEHAGIPRLYMPPHSLPIHIHMCLDMIASHAHGLIGQDHPNDLYTWSGTPW